MEETLLNTQVAAETLHELIPSELPDYWRNFLINNRRTDRNSAYSVPIVYIGRGAFYNPEELRKFADWENGRRIGKLKMTGRAAEVMRAFGIGEVSGGSTGRKLNVTGITAQIDQATKKPFVQLITAEPLMVYRIEPQQAKDIVREMQEIIDFCERVDIKPQVQKLSRHKTLVETGVVRVTRKKDKQ